MYNSFILPLPSTYLFSPFLGSVIAWFVLIGQLISECQTQQIGVMLSLIFAVFSNICVVLQVVLYWIPDFNGSSGVFNTNGSMKTITYGAKPDSGQGISLLCGKLIPLLERLELLSEVSRFPDHNLDLIPFPSMHNFPSGSSSSCCYHQISSCHMRISIRHGTMCLLLYLL